MSTPAKKTQTRASRPAPKVKAVHTTLGELIAAAFDAVGNEIDVTRLLTSKRVGRSLSRRIAVV
jgi:hypothetical protein